MADTSLRTDQLVKLPIYARQRIIEVWVIDLSVEVVHVHTDPVDGNYREVRTLARGRSLSPVEIPDLQLTVNEILGD